MTAGIMRGLWPALSWSLEALGGLLLLAGSLAHLVFFLLVVWHTLRYRRDPTSTLLWIFLAWSFPLLGPLLYLCFGVNRVTAKGWQKQASNERLLSARKEREDASLPLAYWRTVHEARSAEPEDPSAASLNRAMQAIREDATLLGGNRVEPLVSGDEAYPAMLAAIRSAVDHVHLQTFILGADETGEAFVEALRERAAAGVQVRLLLDRFGSTRAWFGRLLRRGSLPPCFQTAAWTQANPLKRQFQVNLRNHRKALIVDGRRAFTGGINLHDENTSRPGHPAIRDYHFGLEGPIVQELQYTFLRDWFFMTGEPAEILLSGRHFPPLEPAGDGLVRVINGGPTSHVEALTDVLFAAFGAAREQILAVTPYLVPPPDLLRAMRAAALRGVDVKLVVPRKNNHPYAGLAGRALYDDLLAAGVRLFERRPPFMHAKALIVDDVVAIIGTANLDSRSLRLNYETNLAVFDPAFADRLKRIVLEDIALSDEIDLRAWRARPTSRRLVENLCNLMAPVL